MHHTTSKLVLASFLIMIALASFALAPFSPRGTGYVQTTLQSTIISTADHEPQATQPHSTTIFIAFASVGVIILFLMICNHFIKERGRRLLAASAVFFAGALIIALTPIKLSVMYETQFNCASAAGCAFIQLDESDIRFNEKLKTILDPVSFRHSDYINYFDEWSIRMFIADQLARNNYDPAYYDVEKHNIVFTYEGHNYLPVIAHMGKDIATQDPLVPIPYLVVMDALVILSYCMVMTVRNRKFAQLSDAQSQHSV